MCSNRCDRPASLGVLEPPSLCPIQNPRAADRTECMDSVTTRTPEVELGQAMLFAQGMTP